MITVQYCPCGHVDTSTDPELIKQDAERAAKGFLDALTLPSEECPECKEYWERQDRLHALYSLPMEDL